MPALPVTCIGLSTHLEAVDLRRRTVVRPQFDPHRAVWADGSTPITAALATVNSLCVRSVPRTSSAPCPMRNSPSSNS
ncbi:MAG: hypothetical protein ABI696_03085 [Rubrivivax sp.]